MLSILSEILGNADLRPIPLRDLSFNDKYFNILDIFHLVQFFYQHPTCMEIAKYI